MSELLPQGFSDFLAGNLDAYEDDSIKCTRNPDGSTLIEGKSLKPVFIYQTKEQE